MDITAIVGLGVAAAVLALVLRDYRPEYGVLIGLAAAVVIVAVVLPQIQAVFQLVERYAALAGGLSARIGPLLKALGIALIAQIGSDACRDCGEGGMASKVELAGRCAILLVTLPLLEELLGVITNLLK